MLIPSNDTPRCTNCNSDLVLTRGAGRVARFKGVTLRLPDAMELWRCHGCGMAYPTSTQIDELHAVAERDLIGYDGRGVPVLRGT